MYIYIYTREQHTLPLTCLYSFPNESHAPSVCPISSHATTLTHTQLNFLLLPGRETESRDGEEQISLPSTSRA